MVDHDVLVVGGGPVGLLLACLVGQDGRRVRVCERRPEPGTQTRAIGIHRPGLDALDAAGVGTGVRSEALRLSGGEVRSRGRRLAALTFTTERPILTLAQPRTEELLRDRLRTLQPDALQSGSVVRSVRDEGPFVRVGIDGEYGRREETASIVVVAEGVRSPLREAFGAGWLARTGTAGYAMLDVDDPPADDRAVLYFEPDGLVESFRCRAAGAAGWCAKTVVGRCPQPPSWRTSSVTGPGRGSRSTPPRLSPRSARPSTRLDGCTADGSCCSATPRTR